VDGVRQAELAIGRRPSPSDPVTAWRLRHLAAGADVVHAHGLRAGALAAAALRMKPRPARGTTAGKPRLVVTLHNAPPAGSTAKAISSVLARMLAGADQVLAVSQDLIDWLGTQGVRQAELTVIPAPAVAPPARSREAVRQEVGLAPGQPLIVQVGRLAPQKGLGLAVDAAAALATRPRPPLWLIVGEGPTRNQLEAQIARLKAPVRLVGASTDVGSYYAAADVVVSTAVWEGQPVALREALRAGCAIVATDVGGTAAALGGTAAAALLVKRELGAVVSGIGHLLDNPEMAAELRRKAVIEAAKLPGEAALLAQVLATYGTGSLR
jgi:glycosyltransferase involved in cell wall biosynthesis